MSDMKEREILLTPGVTLVTATEEVLVSLIRENENSEEVKVETRQRLAIPPPPPLVRTTCEKASVWTLSGSHRTGANGRHSIHLNKFLTTDCLDGVDAGTTFGSWPSFIATPESQEPVFVTYTIQAQPSGGGFFPPPLDLTVEVFSWQNDGTPAANIPFSWVAIARASFSIGG